jgi:hypothetical protein
VTDRKLSSIMKFYYLYEDSNIHGISDCSTLSKTARQHQKPLDLKCSNPFSCLSAVEGEEGTPRKAKPGLILHPVLVDLLVEYCSFTPDIVSRLARTCKTFSTAFPYSANMICMGDFLAGLDYNTYNRKEAQKVKQELSLQIFRSYHKTCLHRNSWEVTLLSENSRVGPSFVHTGVAHLNPRSLTIWIASEDSRSRGGLGVALDIFHNIRTVNCLKACVSRHISLTRNPSAKLACFQLKKDYPAVQHHHWFCKNYSTLIEKLQTIWDDEAETLQPFLYNRLALAKVTNPRHVSPIIIRPDSASSSQAQCLGSASNGSSSPSGKAPERPRPTRRTRFGKHSHNGDWRPRCPQT